MWHRYTVILAEGEVERTQRGTETQLEGTNRK